jgi:beta-lactamase class A
VDNVTRILETKKVKQLTNFDLLATPAKSTVPQNEMENKLVKRLSFLYRIAKFRRLKECILAGVPEELRQLIRDQAAAPGGDVDVVFGDVNSPPSQPDIPFH